MQAPSPGVGVSPRLAALVSDLDALGAALSPSRVAAILRRAALSAEDVSPFVATTPESLRRRRVAITDTFEVLVTTWLPGQASVPHDHLGSLCAFQILGGVVQETRFAASPDSLVEPLESTDRREGEVVVVATDQIHALRNQSDAIAVSLHVHAPPLHELRRYAARPADRDLAPVFARSPARGARVVAIIGGGFCGTMVATHLTRLARESDRPLHVVLVDRQASLGEGPAYRTDEARHLLNVPASNMSAWPERPADFLEWSKARDPRVRSATFLPRRSYGEYVRETFLAEARCAGAATSIEVRRADATAIERRSGRWQVQTDQGPAIAADAVVLATGHRRPDDPLARCWSGSRARYVADPWASLPLSAIAPHESVLLLGTGLTAIDALLSVAGPDRTAPIVALSRRGLRPASHAPAPLIPIDPRAWLDPMLTRADGPSARELVRAVVHAARSACARGDDWRQVIDGLRPYSGRIWRSLSRTEAERFLRHARPFWEVHRHRMAPEIGRVIDDLTHRKLFRTHGGRTLSAHGSVDGVLVELRPRHRSTPETLRVDWVVNCTGPGSSADRGLVPIIESLVAAGYLEIDPLGLGVGSDVDGRARAGATVLDDLLVVGTLRKPDCWESTAVPELRQQAAIAARIALHIP